MLKIKDYPTLRRQYPDAFYITSDFRRNSAEALLVNVAQVYFEDERGRHYFGEPVYEVDVYIEADRPEYPREYLGAAW